VKTKLDRSFFFGLALILAATISVRPGQHAQRNSTTHPKTNLKKPVKLIGAIYLPGNPLRLISVGSTSPRPGTTWAKRGMPASMCSTPRTICSWDGLLAFMG